jgi:alginate O-acetyltransferase complex protein AlgI
MWMLAITVGQFLKWLAWRDAREAGLPMTIRRSVNWFFLWPGLDSHAFFAREAREPRPARREWLIATAKLVSGVTLIWVAAPLALAYSPAVTGWIAMVGIVLGLHFGLFHLLSLAWRTVGVDAQPIMNRPLTATSLTELWGERWNTAFSIPARRFLFNPLARRYGSVAANLVVFLVSGALHELVISVPAGGGYGLPTAYFLLQGAGVLFERSRPGRGLGLGRGARGWLFTLILALTPVYWLFHPPFIRNVILPMLQASSAI